MFAYCNSNPVCAADPSGQVAQAISRGDQVILDGAGTLVVTGIIFYLYKCSNNASKTVSSFPIDTPSCETSINLKSLLLGILTVAAIERRVRRGDGNIYSVYFLTDESYKNDENAPIFYVGRVKTCNKSKRLAYHKLTRHLDEAFSIDGLTYEQARGIEELGMVLLGSLRGQFPYNIIHGISAVNPNRSLYLYNALNLFDHEVSQELLDLYETYIG